LLPTAVTAALFVVDPSARSGGFTHWLAYDIPLSVEEAIESAGAPFDELPEAGTQGDNDFASLGFSGPCPPRGETHLYALHVYAVDTNLGLPSRSTRATVLI